jgi:DNA adenine methylase
MDATQLKPFLRWAGGKQKLLPFITKFIPKDFDCYYEPFHGGGALLLHMKPQKFIGNDLNDEIINVYNAIRYNVKGLLKVLKQFKNKKEDFYIVRSIDRSSDYNLLNSIDKAARILYLNKTCFNGLFRVNSRKQFNVSYGDRQNIDMVSADNLGAVSQFFNRSQGKIVSSDFSCVMKLVQKNDFVYLDPPYDALNGTSFTAYTEFGFDKSDQQRLKGSCDRLNQIGRRFLLSNSDTPFVRELYKNYKIETISVRRNIAAKAESRHVVGELLIRNFEAV